MPANNKTTITGEFDHTGGVYRLTVLIPLNVAIEQSTMAGGSTATTMLWVGELITNQANSLIEEEKTNNPLKGFGNERLSG